MTEDKPQKKTSARNPPRGQPPAGGSAVAATDGKSGEAGSGDSAAAPGKNRRLAGIRSRISIEELRNVYKRQASQTQDDGADPIFDPMAKAQESLGVVRGRTGVVYSREMARHRCLWDDNHAEKPDRLLSVLDRCEELGLLAKCERLECRAATEEEVLRLHSPAHLSLLQTTSTTTDADKLEDLASRFDSIYFHPATYESALLAAGGTLDLVDAVAAGRLQNGFAIVRPPGHHAMESEFCGYSFVNNVALAARHALNTHRLSRILIVDWDVHHGQATQQAFYSDPRVLYFSIHRYEHGSFWPNLRESNYDYIGRGDGRGFNFNVPLNTTGMTNHDFLAILHQVLLPVAYEFNPELVIVSAGYDAALGCPEFGPELVVVSAGYDSAMGDEKGEMEVSPGLYAHLTSQLMTLARGKVAVVLEGGYCLPSLAESAAHTLSALLGHHCPPLMDPILQPSPSLQETLLSLVYVQRAHWRCFQYQGSFSQQEVRGEADPKTFTPSLSFQGLVGVRPLRFQTRDTVQLLTPQTQQLRERIDEKLLKLRKEEAVVLSEAPGLCLVYDEQMEQHRSLTEGEHPERPERIQRVWEMLGRAGVLGRGKQLQSRVAQREEVELVHSKEHVALMFSLEAQGEEELQILQENYKSVYLHPTTNACALLSAGSLLQVVDEVFAGRARAGVGIVRPPGHHAEPDRPHGFCFYNNVAVAASYAVNKLGCQRVLVVDWDVHHGNGIQHAFEAEPRVLYVSLHRYDHGLFFPSSEDANYDRVGTGPGEGYNINIPWNKSGMGDAEYLAAFTQVVLPVAYQFNPQLVLVAAGFDAGRGDPLGGCRVSPECFGHMTALLSGLAEGRVILALEGGYNLTTISYCMTLCAKALLGDPLPPLEPQLVPNKSAVQTINDVIRTHSHYWPALCFQVDLPLQDVLQQGFGGGPQVVDSGVSGSEGSATASPTSPPSTAKSSPTSSPSTTATTSPYVSAPSSPAKPVAMECEVQAGAGAGQEQGASDSKDEVFTTPTGARPRTQCLETPPSRSPRRAQRGSGRQDRSSSKRQGRVAEAMQAAAATRDVVKGPTGVCCGAREEGGPVQAVVEHCRTLGLWQACTMVEGRMEDGLSLVASCVGRLVQEVVQGKIQNGLTVVESQCGQDSGGVGRAVYSALGAGQATGRVLLVDCCGRPGSWLQHTPKDDPQLLVMSLQWQQHSAPAITGAGSNVLSCVVPPDTAGCCTLAHQVLLPVAYEFMPRVVVVAVGQEWTTHTQPALLAQLAALFMPVARGCLLVALEAGHQGIQATGAAGAAILGTLLHGTAALTVPAVSMTPSPEVCQVVLGVIKTHQACWNSLRHHALASLVPAVTGHQETPPPSPPSKLTSTPEAAPTPLLKGLKREGPGVCLVYSEAMKEHTSYSDPAHPENPNRISRIYEQLSHFDIVERCHILKAREASTEELERTHSPRHIRFMFGLQAMKPSELHRLENSFESVYLHSRTNHAALLAAGSLVEAVDCVVSGQSQHGLAVVRPPGHHAERNSPCGFCFYNSVAVAAQHAVAAHHMERVLVLDWDVHHGNGTQHIFEADPRVLYISIHRYDHGKFFPGSRDANFNHVGIKKGKGFNINIPWNKGGMGDAEYLAAFLQVVLPVATEFNPQLVLVSAGFDAAVGDPLGGCSVTPECYGHMTKFLTSVGAGRVIVALEGGYNLTSISYCMTMCAKALLGDPVPPLPGCLHPCQSAVDSLTSVVTTHSKFWSALNYKGEASRPGRRQGTPTSTPTSTPQAVDELAASLSQVSLGEATPTKAQVEVPATEEMEGACGGSNTLLVSGCIGAELYAVVPVSWCPHLEEVQPVPEGGLNTSSPCEECQDVSENWCCLTCYKVLCGRFVAEHMLMHGVCEQHHMVLSFSDLSSWCYACDVYVHNPILFEAKRAAHLDKFGEEPPGEA
ncbi:histone deacetylase 6-like isoform X2 [Eriocheir sinensis]|uniref:histone deacetylase 6-like isoform X2 n=1 Tax=Eriocheir sinensis TaxID=95602 RepID=UPI0021C7E632|nr:histone deacetylase 6-like isoform X2 [Eriocheir sinensis]